MTVIELKKMLDKYPDDMEIVNERCSDFELIKEDEWRIVRGVVNDSGWIMRSHPTMIQESKEKEKEYLCLDGN